MRRPSGDPADPHGVADLLARACGAVATTAVEGTRFVFSTKEMLRVSREIEQAALVEPADPLYVGVQHGHRLDVQDEVYSDLINRGVTVFAFGTDEGTVVDGVQWVRVHDDDRLLAASWFLVRGGSDAHALVGFEVGEPIDGVRQWEGFESRDSRLVDGMIRHLDAHLEGSAARAG
ncbi:hypothetical protein [Euzebya tangerina]|uniref:hypothetical protein n=1 Tax=Euzebya tangerina TaxID=591198 RepID=UPI0013C2EC8F|nr:hypothetical protein [Euzebya tangerina]